MRLGTGCESIINDHNYFLIKERSKLFKFLVVVASACGMQPGAGLGCLRHLFLAFVTTSDFACDFDVRQVGCVSQRGALGF